MQYILADVVRSGRAAGIDWDYITTVDITFVIDKPYFIPPCEFRNQWLWIRCLDGKWYITVSKGYAFDGCTGVPDFKGTVLGALFHDAIYQFVLELVQCWKLSRVRILRFGDDVFYEAMIFYGTNPKIAKTYYWGVRGIGAPFNYVAGWVRSVKSWFA